MCPDRSFYVFRVIQDTFFLGPKNIRHVEGFHCNSKPVKERQLSITGPL